MRQPRASRKALVVSRPWLALAVVLPACSAGTEPTTNPLELRTNPREVGAVYGTVVTPGPVRSTGAAETVDPTRPRSGSTIEIGAVKPSRPLAGIVVELGIVHFSPITDSAAPGATGHMVLPMAVPDAWSGSGTIFLAPGPASPPGRLEVIATTATDAHGAFRFRKAPRREVLLLRARPPAPYQETYTPTPFWLGNSRRRRLPKYKVKGPTNITVGAEATTVVVGQYALTGPFAKPGLAWGIW